MIVISRAEWLYEGEQNSKYFCNLEKKDTLCRKPFALFKRKMVTLFMTVIQ